MPFGLRQIRNGLTGGMHAGWRLLLGVGLCSALALVAPCGWGQHYIPANKNLSEETVAAMFARGEQKVYRGDERLTIGMPCGGIGTGQLYVRGDGTLARWWIFNEKKVTWFRKKDPVAGYRTYRPPSRLDQGFAVAATPAGGEPVTLRLSDEGFDGIEFVGEYPIATIRYRKPKDEGFPLHVDAEVLTPYSPLDARMSGHPATVLRYTLTNPTAVAVDVDLAGWLEHGALPEADDSTKARRRIAPCSGEGYAGVVMDLVGADGATTPADDAPRVAPIDDFETPVVGADGTTQGSGSLDKWVARGTAFGPTASRMTGERAAYLKGVKNFVGEHVLCSGAEDPEALGTLTSEPFEIREPYLGFRLGGVRRARWVNGPEPRVVLLVDGEVVRSARGGTSPKLAVRSWEVRDLIGRAAQIRVDDQNPQQDLLLDDLAQHSHNPEGEAPLPRWRAGFGDMTLVAMDAGDGLDGPVVVGTGGGSQELVATLGSASQGSAQTQLHAISAGAVGSVRRSFRLEPGESRSATFAVTWHFPNLINTNKGAPGQVGRMYANWFRDAQDVAAQLSRDAVPLLERTRRFRDTLYLDTTLPYWMVQRSSMSLSTLASATVEWWKSGRFYSWEGVGFCIGTCGHVWNYAQGPARWFPSLERSVRSMQDFDPQVAWKPSGRINFRGYNDNSESFKNWGYIPDAQAGYVLKAYREHLVSADDGFLDDHWSRIKRSVEYLIERDGRHGPTNGILEGMQHFTDSLGWGPNTFTGSLYLAALRAGQEMATRQNDPVFAERCEALFASGRQWTLENLWGGEYFIHAYSPAPKGALSKDGAGRSFGDGCLSDQMFGQNWAHQLGLGYLYPVDRVRTALASVYKYNWTPDMATVYAKRKKRFILLAHPGESGLVGCSFPKGDPPPNVIHQNEDPWTGYEYQAASGMIWEGLLQEGLSIAYGVHQRYDGASNNPWCEIEGGDHYSRAMSSWGVMLAATGFEYNGPAGHLGFAPRLSPGDFRGFFSGAEGWGSMAQTRDDAGQRQSIEVRWGRVQLETLAFELAPGATVKAVAVTRDGTALASSFTQQGTRVEVRLDRRLTLAEGQTLGVDLAVGE